MTFRVIHFGTGYSGIHALRGIIDHPELELAGLVVHSEDKAGRDAGDIAGVGPVGVVATRDLGAALAGGADAFCYMASTHGRFKAAIAEVCQILAGGTNVVTTSFGLLIHPGSARPDVLARLDDAGRRGGASLLSTGIEPGFFSDYLPVILSGCAHRIDALRVYELAVYESGHQSDEVAFDICGFGGSVDTAPPIVDPAGMLPWAGVVRSMAEQLGVELDEIRTSFELLGADHAFEYQGRRIEAGTIAGFRFEIAGVVGGATRVAVEHVTRTRADQASHWPKSAAGDVYRVVLEGSPHLECEFSFREGDDHLAGGFNITAMRAVNAIPALGAAPAGVVSTFDLTPVTGRGRVAV
jgi:hypothetical protein